MPDVARETRDHPPKRLMGYYDICQTPLFLATNGKRPVHLTYDFSLRQNQESIRITSSVEHRKHMHRSHQLYAIFKPNLVRSSKNRQPPWRILPNSVIIKIQDSDNRHIEFQKMSISPVSISGLDKHIFTKFVRRMHQGHTEMIA